MLTKGIMQDANIDTDEACVIKHWLEEHKEGGEFDFVITKLDKFLTTAIAVLTDLGI